MPTTVQAALRARLAALPSGRARVPQGALGLAVLIAATAVVAAGAADDPSLLVHVPPGRFAGWLAGPLHELEAAAPSAPVFAGLLSRWSPGTSSRSVGRVRSARGR